MAIEEEPKAGIPEWVVTFGDMMSLLLTFFIMLVSLSEIKEQEKYQALVESMQKRFGYDATMASLVPGNSKPRNSKFSKLATVGRAKRKDTMSGGDKTPAARGDYSKVRIIRPGIKIATGTSIRFVEGSAKLDDEARQALRQQILQMIGKPQKIEIRGHTSQKPVDPRTGFADNWELAFQRTRAVFDFVTEELNVDPKRVRLSVAGANEPVTDDASQLSKNPRVEIFMLDEVVSDLQGNKTENIKRFTDEGPQ